jgi:hypothetical protein
MHAPLHATFVRAKFFVVIHSELTLRSVDNDRAGRPLRGDLHIDRFEYVPEGRRLMAVKPLAGAD